MKRVAVFIFVMSIFSSSSAFALAVNLLDSNYSYEIFNYGNCPGSPACSGSISGTTSGDQLQTNFNIYPWLGGQVAAEPFSLFAESISTTDHIEDLDCFGYGHAFVSSKWLFHPTQTANELEIIAPHSSSYDAKYIILNDITDNREIFNGTSAWYLGEGYLENQLSHIWEGYFSNTIDHDYSDLVIDNFFFTDHIYELKLGLVAQSGQDFWTSRIAANLDIAKVPEPPTSILFAVALFGVLIISRRKLRLHPLC